VGGKDKQVRERGAWAWPEPQAAEKGKKTRDTRVSLSKMGVTAVSPCVELLPQPTTGELPVH